MFTRECANPSRGRNRTSRGGAVMIKVKTFTNELRIFHTMNELSELDDQVISSYRRMA
jgi:hypothetical protein